MDTESPWYDRIALPALLRHARTIYGVSMRRALEEAGYDDIPGNGLYVIGGLANGREGFPIRQLVRELRVSKQAAGQLVDTLVMRGYLNRDTDPQDRRQLIVTLTPRGQAAAEIQSQARAAIDAQLLALAGAEDVGVARRVLGTLIEMARELREPAE